MVFSVTFLAGHGEICMAILLSTWVIHMATHRPAHNTPIHMDLVPLYRKPYKKSMWIGVLWADLRVAMWITHVQSKFRHGLLEKSLIFGGAETGTKMPISPKSENFSVAMPADFRCERKSFEIVFAIAGTKL